MAQAVARAVKMYTEGEKVAVILEETRLETPQVYAGIRAAGIELRGVPRVLAEYGAELRERYEAGESLQTLADVYGAEAATIRRRIIEQGGAIRARSGGRQRGRMAGQDDEIVRLYIEERMSGAQIAARLGGHAPTVYVILQNRGIEMRPNTKESRENKNK